jgi:Zn-dependent peptidase ImmA (M78 family)
MHELAHNICGHETSKSQQINGLGLLLREYNEEQEKEAEWLGSCLQLPRKALVWALNKKMSYEEISEYFQASEDMVRFRINTTGVKKQISYWKRNQ